MLTRIVKLSGFSVFESHVSRTKTQGKVTLKLYFLKMIFLTFIDLFRERGRKNEQKRAGGGGGEGWGEKKSEEGSTLSAQSEAIPF